MQIDHVIHQLNNQISNNPHFNQQSFIKQEEHDYQPRIATVKPEDVERTVNNLNRFMEPLRTNLKFTLHNELNEYYVEVINPMTDEVIREIPPKKFLDMYAAMADFMGLLIDKKI